MLKAPAAKAARFAVQLSKRRAWVQGQRNRSNCLTLRRFRREECGLAALEFALILPVLITMLFGMGELSLAVFCRSDVSQIAGTVADLIAQESIATTADISNVYFAANTILYPYYPNISTAKPSIRISSVIFDTTTNSTTVGKVAWSCMQSGNASFVSGPAGAIRATNSTFTFSQPLLSSGGSVVMAEVAYSYASPTTMLITGPIAMTNSFYSKPRRVGQIPAPTCP
jgi:Flp pilus assembly protein TadG